MPENPLLPNRKLKALYTLMQRCRKLDGGGREALLAATTMHLQAGDVLCADSGDSALAALAPAGRSKRVPAGLVAPPQLAFASKLATAASMARGQLASSPADALALTAVYCTAGAAEPGWQHALTVAQRVPLPLIVVVADTPGTRAGRGPDALTWPRFSSFAKRRRLPVLCVDGADAVAVYRCMQEAVLRARAGDGCAVVWAVLGAGTRPLARLKKYLADRKIALPR